MIIYSHHPRVKCFLPRNFVFFLNMHFHAYERMHRTLNNKNTVTHVPRNCYINYSLPADVQDYGISRTVDDKILMYAAFKNDKGTSEGSVQCKPSIQSLMPPNTALFGTNLTFQTHPLCGNYDVCMGLGLSLARSVCVQSECSLGVLPLSRWLRICSRIETKLMNSDEVSSIVS